MYDNVDGGAVTVSSEGTRRCRRFSNDHGSELDRAKPQQYQQIDRPYFRIARAVSHRRVRHSGAHLL